MDSKEVAKNALNKLMLDALDIGAEPLPVLTDLQKLEKLMRTSYWTGDLVTALKYAEQIGTMTQQERNQIDSKWTGKFKSKEYQGNPFEGPEYMQDFANMQILDIWLESYGENGTHIKPLREVAGDVADGKKAYKDNISLN